MPTLRRVNTHSASGFVLLICDVIGPLRLAFADSQMGHEVIGCSPMPVPLPARSEDGVPWAQGENAFSTRLDATLTLRDIEALANGVVVPGGAPRPGGLGQGRGVVG